MALVEYKFKAGIDKLSEQQSTPKKEPRSKKASTGGIADLAIQTGLRFAAGETLPKAILEGSEFIAGQKEKGKAILTELGNSVVNLAEKLKGTSLIDMLMGEGDIKSWEDIWNEIEKMQEEHLENL